MSTAEYTYVILRYVHDPAAGESMNVGVVLYAPQADGGPFLGVAYSSAYQRLSDAFAGFDGEAYRTVMRRLETAFLQLKSRWRSSMFFEAEAPADAHAVVRMFWPDAGLSYVAGESLPGVDDDLDEALKDVYERFVDSQYVKHASLRREDEDVWRTYRASLERLDVAKRLVPAKLNSDGLDFEFKHTFKNGKINVLQPLSLDYSDANSLRRKIAQQLGIGVALQGNEDLGTIYLLLGRPQRKDMLDEYFRAKKLLEHRMPGSHELLEEGDADRLAERVGAIVAAHDQEDERVKQPA